MTVTNTPRFKIGTKYRTSGKAPRLCTVIDIWTTYDDAGNIVMRRYVSEHEFMGQRILDRDVLATTIAKGLVEEI